MGTLSGKKLSSLLLNAFFVHWGGCGSWRRKFPNEGGSMGLGLEGEFYVGFTVNQTF